MIRHHIKEILRLLGSRDLNRACIGFEKVVNEMVTNTKESKECDIALNTKSVPACTEPSAYVKISEIPFQCLCKLHLMPISGTVSVAYWPKNSHILESECVLQVIDWHTKKLQMPESLGVEIAEYMRPSVRQINVKTFTTCECVGCVSRRGGGRETSITLL
jgi:GTP cyclohydrolase I